MVKNIIFDMGRVLIDWDPDLIIARLGVSGEEARLLRREVFDNVEWASMDRGTLSQEDGLRAVCRRLPERLHGYARSCVMDWWREPLVPIEGMDELVRELKALGYGVYLLSNAASTLHEFFHRLPGADCFDGLVVSADEGLLKPQKEIYQVLFDRYGLDPADCLFIDDNPLNVDGAHCVGLPALVFFNDMPRLRAELREAGVQVQP